MGTLGPLGAADPRLPQWTPCGNCTATPAGKGSASLKVLNDGVQAWTVSGRPLTIAQNKPWSMERLVRVTAGALVLTFFGLGLLTSKKFFFARVWSVRALSTRV